MISPFRKNLDARPWRYFSETFFLSKIGFPGALVFAGIYLWLLPDFLQPKTTFPFVWLTGIGLGIFFGILIIIRNRFFKSGRKIFSAWDSGKTFGIHEAQEALAEITLLYGRSWLWETLVWVIFVLLPLAWMTDWHGLTLVALLTGTGFALLINGLLAERWAGAPVISLREKFKNLRLPEIGRKFSAYLYFTAVALSVLALVGTTVLIVQGYSTSNSRIDPSLLTSTVAVREIIERTFTLASTTILLESGLILMVLCLFIGWTAAAQQYSLSLLATAVTALEKGDFSSGTSRPHLYGLGWLGLHLDNAVQKIRDRIQYLQKNGLEMYSTTSRISTISSEQNQSLVRQSASLSQTSTTLEEMVRSAGQISDHASAVVRLAEDTERAAQKGLGRMQETGDKINNVESKNQANLSDIVGLSEQIQEIEQILRFINAIADETNLIALNATIEASSAGEHGQRFKVVASEVRDLSDRVSNSVKNIQQMINRIQEATGRLVTVAQQTSEETAESVRLAGQTFENLKEILDWAKKSSDAAKQIYISINQQRLANKQISLSFGDISMDMKSLASSSERYAETVESLKKFSTNMEAVVQYFVKQHTRQNEKTAS